MSAAEERASAWREPERLVVPATRPLADRELPRVAIVILNWNGRAHLAPCFESLARLDYPADRREVVLVDNGSTDGSLEELRRSHGWVRLVANPRNLGFSAGCNQGAHAAGAAEVLVFLNNDMRVAPGFLRALVAPIVRGEAVATTARMWSWDGTRLNSAGGGMNFHGIGIQKGYLEEPHPRFDVPRKTLFCCGGAMAMGARAFADVGGFDERFFAYYEDVDLGWRSWVLGHECRYVPAAECWHHHSSTSRRMPRETVRLLQTRNPVLACFKNYDDEHLRAFLAPILALHARRTWAGAGLADDRAFRIELVTEARPAGARGLLARLFGGREETVPVQRIAAADLIGLNDLLGDFDAWLERRAAVQRRRARPDAEIFELFLKPHWCIEEERGYVELQRGLERLFGLDRKLPPDAIPAPRS